MATACTGSITVTKAGAQIRFEPNPVKPLMYAPKIQLRLPHQIQMLDMVLIP